LTYFSVFSGIEAASVAWQELGYDPVGFSEIDPFCCAVLAHRFPAVTNYGDIKKYKEWKIERAVDVVVGGSPCQSYSIAGDRQGSKVESGRLMFTYGNFVNYMRPRWLVWENVDGVLSSNKGRDFEAFLGMLDEYGYGLAWRVFDAQYFGVPQHRRRVFVIGYLGDVRRPTAVLIDTQGGGGNTAPRKKEGGGASRRTGKNAEATVYNVHQHDSRIKKSDGLIDAVTRLWGTGGNNTPLCLADQIVFNRATISKYKADVRAAALLGDHHDKGLVSLVPDAADGLLRRIMPVEAERLQGFPDNWTKVPYKKKSADVCPDGPRYTAIGNSMAVPVMGWLGARIALVEAIFGEAA